MSYNPHRTDPIMNNMTDCDSLRETVGMLKEQLIDNELRNSRIIDNLVDIISDLRDGFRDIAENYDHEEYTREHKQGYGGQCRVCLAERMLREYEIPRI